jgi:hypothetical protein
VDFTLAYQMEKDIAPGFAKPTIFIQLETIKFTISPENQTVLSGRMVRSSRKRIGM